MRHNIFLTYVWNDAKEHTTNQKHKSFLLDKKNLTTRGYPVHLDLLTYEHLQAHVDLPNLQYVQPKFSFYFQYFWTVMTQKHWRLWVSIHLTSLPTPKLWTLSSPQTLYGFCLVWFGSFCSFQDDSLNSW